MWGKLEWQPDDQIRGLAIGNVCIYAKQEFNSDDFVNRLRSPVNQKIRPYNWKPVFRDIFLEIGIGNYFGALEGLRSPVNTKICAPKRGIP